MATSYTSLLGLALPVTGELSGTWGDTVNDYITQYLDAAIAGTQTISGSLTAVTLSKTTNASLSQAGTGATGSSQYQIINCTGNPASELTVTVPAASKEYIVINATSTSQNVKIVGAGPTTGVTVVSGERCLIAWNGSDFVKIGGTNGAGSFTTLTTSSTVTLNGGTANGVAYLNGSKVLTSGSALTFDGTTFNAPNSVITSSSSSAALRITQTGSGNALVVEDSANPDATPFLVTADGRVGIGVPSASFFPGNIGLYITANDGNSRGLIQRMTTDSGGTQFYLRKGRGTVESPAAVANGDRLGTLSFAGWGDASSTYDGASIVAEVDGTPGTNDMPGRLVFSTTADGASSPTERYRISNDGTSTWSVAGSEQMRLTSTGLGIGTSSPATKLDVQISGGRFQVYPAVTATGVRLLSVNTGNSAAVPMEISGTDIRFTNSSNSLVGIFDSSGNLGLGVTPSAWRSGQSVIQMGYANFSQYSGLSAQVGYNFYTDSGGTNRYIASSLAATNYYQASGAHIWNTAPSGTAGNAISFTQAMTLDASGNLIVPYRAVVGQTISGDSVLQVASAYGGLRIGYNSTNVNYFDGDTQIFRNSAGTAERARIDSSGNLLVGKTSASTTSGTGVQFRPDGSVSVVAPSALGDTFDYYNSTAGAFRFYVTNAGVINATSTTITAISDQRLKENIQDIDAGLNKVMALKPRKFDWKPGKGKDIKGDRGWIAQEFEQVFPDMVTTWKDKPPEGEEPYKAVNADLIPVLVKAIQEQQAQIEQLRAEIQTLKGN